MSIVLYKKGEEALQRPHEETIMLIDIHGHFTTLPESVSSFRNAQIDTFDKTGLAPDIALPVISDKQITDALESNQIRVMKERGVDLTVFSPKASAMDHHRGNEQTNVVWTKLCNDLVHRACLLFPKHFVGACQLPQVSGQPPRDAVIEELRRCVTAHGCVAANLNPDPSGGYWLDPPLSDKAWWYPLFEELVALDVPAMIHVTGSCNPHFHTTATHYINADTTAFVQFLTSTIFQDFPTLKFVIPHGGGAVPFHWGRYRGLAQDMGLPDLSEKVLKNVFFDTCVYHQAGIDLMLKVLPSENILFGSEIFGAIKGVDPTTGHYFDDVRRYVDQSEHGTPTIRQQIFSSNAQRGYPRLKPFLACRAC